MGDVAFAGPYVLSKVLGHGSYGKVKMGKHGKTGEEVAVKILKKSDITKSAKTLVRVEREVTIMRLMSHPCVTRMIDVIQSEDHLFIVLELLKGGDLFHYLRTHGIGGLPANTAFTFFYQILSGLEYCHSCCICHRDIKPENILLDADNCCKLADFGMANLVHEDKMMETSCGSPHYAAPEVIRGGKYDGMKSDLWSLGVLLFGLFAGRLPFDDQSIPRLLDKVCKGKYRMPSHFDEQLQDLITQLLQADVEKRISIAKIKETTFWLNNCKRLGLNPKGLHTIASSRSIPPGLTDDTTIVTSTQDSPPAALGLDPKLSSDVDELRNAIAAVQRYARHLIIENSSMVNMLQSNPPQPDSSEPIQPEHMQQPISEPYDHEVIQFITETHKWSDPETLVNTLKSDKPALEKAFYNLLVRHKAQNGSLSSLAVRRVAAATPVSLNAASDAPQSAMHAMLRNCRQKSDTALLASGVGSSVDSHSKFGFGDDEKKKKGILNRIFKKGKDKEPSASGSNTVNVRPSIPGLGSSLHGHDGQTHVQFMSKSAKQMSAPNLMSS